MEEDFYNAVAKKFKGKFPLDCLLTIYQNGSPEVEFLNEVIKYSSNSYQAIDIGCGSGNLTLYLAHSLKKIIGVDTSSEMLKLAFLNQVQQKIRNCHFSYGDINALDFPNSTFDLAINRRSPHNYKEISRILKNNGVYVSLFIGENDCTNLKKQFGRGQGFGEWKFPYLEVHRNELTSQGMKILLQKNFLFDEYFDDIQKLDLLLQFTPLIGNYDRVKDNLSLERYAKDNLFDQGIRLSRHLCLVVVQK